MKKTIGLIAMILFSICSFSQTWQWADRMGSVLQDSVNTSDYNEKVVGVGTDNAGNVYVAGKVMGHPTFGDSSFTSQNHGNYYQGFLAKYDCSGHLKWAQLMLDNNGADNITGLAVDGAGNCYLNGYAGSDTEYFDTTHYYYGNNTPGWFVAKYDSSGHNLWRTFTQVTPSAFNEDGPTIAINSQGNIIVAGWNDMPGMVFTGVNLRKGNFIAAFNPNAGSCLWGINIDTVAPNSNAKYLSISSLVIGSDDDIYIGGSFNDTVKVGTYTLVAPNLGFHACIIKYNSNGILKWAKQDYAASSSTSLFTLSISGNSIYMLATALRNDTVFNYPISFTGSSLQTNFILKLDTAANFIWGITQDSVNIVYSGPLPSMIVDNNNLYLTSGFLEQLKWGTTYPSINSNSGGGPDPYFLELNSSGQVVSLTSISSFSTSINPYDGGEGIAISSTGDIYVGGAFSDRLWAGIDTVHNSGGNVDLFLVKYGSSCSTTGIDEIAKEDNYLKVFPNPNNGKFHIVLSSDFH